MEMPPPLLKALFLHFFDIHFIEEKGRVAETPQFFAEMRLATRIAVSAAEHVYVPAASYFESPLCQRIIGELDELCNLGFIRVVGSSPSLKQFVLEHSDTAMYRPDSLQHMSYAGWLDTGSLPYLQRERSATKDINSDWAHIVGSGILQRRLRDATNTPILNIERRLDRVPQELAGQAFIPEYVFEILDVPEDLDVVRSRVRNVINEAYFSSYTSELEAGILAKLNLLASTLNTTSSAVSLSFGSLHRFLLASGRLAEFLNCSPVDLIKFSADPNWRVAVSRASIPPVSIGSKRVSDQRSYSALLIVAADSELRAVRAELDETLGASTPEPIDAAKSDYVLQYLDTASGATLFLSAMPFQGEVEAVKHVMRLQASLQPSVTLMIGMCMGIPARRLDIGTVVIPNEVTLFDHQRLTTEGVKFRPHGDRVVNGIWKLAQLVASGGEELPYKVVVNKGMGSASVKIEDPSAALVKHIEANFPDIEAFDMEAAGFYSGAGDLPCILMKSVADNGEPQLNPEAKRAVQMRVTRNAANFALRLVRSHAKSEATTASE